MININELKFDEKGLIPAIVVPLPCELVFKASYVHMFAV